VRLRTDAGVMVMRRFVGACPASRRDERSRRTESDDRVGEIAAAWIVSTRKPCLERA
jgi:hypothetical protein